MWMCLVPSVQKRELSSLELELQTRTTMWVLKTTPGSSGRAASALSHCTISPVLEASVFYKYCSLSISALTFKRWFIFNECRGNRWKIDESCSEMHGQSCEIHSWKGKQLRIRISLFLNLFIIFRIPQVPQFLQKNVNLINMVFLQRIHSVRTRQVSKKIHINQP